jgi:hypothetical protein
MFLQTLLSRGLQFHGRHFVSSCTRPSIFCVRQPLTYCFVLRIAYTALHARYRLQNIQWAGTSTLRPYSCLGLRGLDRSYMAGRDGSVGTTGRPCCISQTPPGTPPTKSRRMAYLNAKLQQHMRYGTEENENVIVGVGHREKRFKAPNFTGMRVLRFSEHLFQIRE